MGSFMGVSSSAEWMIWLFAVMARFLAERPCKERSFSGGKKEPFISSS